MYEVAKNLIGPLPVAFEFIYAIVTFCYFSIACYFLISTILYSYKISK